MSGRQKEPQFLVQSKEMDEVELRFTEGEVADVLWALYEAIELADQLDALSTRAHLERVYGFVRDRFDQRRPDGQ